MPVHKIQPSDLLQMSVKCFIASPSNQCCKVKDEKVRFIVLTSKQYTGSLKFTLSFYENESKYNKRRPFVHEQELDQIQFCGFVKGTTARRGKDDDGYIALIFEMFTVILTIKGGDAHTEDVLTKWEKIVEDHFEHIISRSVRLKSYPGEERTTLNHQDRIRLCATKRRLSLCSETDYHMRIYTWNFGDIAVCYPQPGEMKLEVMHIADHPGVYEFASGHCSAIQLSLGDQIYQSVDNIDPYSVSSPSKHGRSVSRSFSQVSNMSQTQSIRRPSLSSVSSFGSGVNRQLPSPPTSRLSSLLQDPFFPHTDEHSSEIEDTYLTCPACNSLYSTYVNQAMASNSPIRKESPGFPDEDDYLDLNDLCAEREEDIRLITYSELGDQRYLRTCPSHRASSCTIGSSESISSSAPYNEAANHMNRRAMLRSKSESHDDRISIISADARTSEIFKSINELLRRKSSTKDTLALGKAVRCQLCLRLYLPSLNTVGTCLEDWQLLGEKIGLCCDAINLISAIVRNHSLEYPAGEVVLRHWQYIYNKYGDTDRRKCPIPCNKHELIVILKELKRHDLVELVTTGTIATV